MASPEITICPPAPQDVHFDTFVHPKSFNHMVSQESCLSWADTRSMQLAFHPGKRGRRWVPTFANNDTQLRHVIADVVWKHIHPFSGGHIPSGLIEDRVILEQMCIAADNERATRQYGRKPGDITDEMWTRHIGSIQLAGSYMALISTIAYRSWRLGQESPVIAEQMGLTPVGVRKHLHNMVRTARELGYEAHVKPSPRLGKEGIRTPHKVKLPPGPQLIEEVERDGYKAIAARYDVLRISVYKAYGIAKGYTDVFGHRTGKRPRRSIIFTPELLAQVEQLRTKGLTFKKIAAKLGVNKDSLAGTWYLHRATQGAAALKLVG